MSKPKTHRMGLRLTEKQRKAFVRAAKSARLSPSEWAREVLSKAAGL